MSSKTTTTRTVAKTPATKAPATKKLATATAGSKQVAKKSAPTGNWISQRAQAAVAGVGGYAAGYVYNVGNGVNTVGRGIGDSIANTTRYWGQGVAGYGNEIKDVVKAGGPRVATAGNPLGLSGMGSSKSLMPGGKLPAGSGVRNAGRGSAGNPLGL